jgi:hypothetical protein
VTSSAGQIEIQEWNAGYWRPSLTPLYRVRECKPAPDDLLEALRVPRSEWDAVPSVKWETPVLVRITRDMNVAARKAPERNES